MSKRLNINIPAEIDKLFDTKVEMKQIENQEDTKPIDEVTKKMGNE